MLNLPELKVIPYEQFQDLGILLTTESIYCEKICPRCGHKSYRLHQNHRYIIKDLSWEEFPVFLKINRRQFKCETCRRPFSEKLEFVTPRRRYTKRLAARTIKDVLDSNIQTVAKKGIVTTEEIERMLKDAMAECQSRKPSGIKRLGIDEISLVKGKGNYCAVLIDLDKSERVHPT